ESRAHLGDVGELLAFVETHVQGAESRARALRLRVAADHELLPAVALHLDPVRRTLPLILAREPLGYDSLETHLRRRLEESGTVLEHVIGALHGTERGHDASQQLLALGRGTAAR